MDSTLLWISQWLISEQGGRLQATSFDLEHTHALSTQRSVDELETAQALILISTSYVLWISPDIATKYSQAELIMSG